MRESISHVYIGKKPSEAGAIGPKSEYLRVKLGMLQADCGRHVLELSLGNGKPLEVFRRVHQGHFFFFLGKDDSV